MCFLLSLQYSVKRATDVRKFTSKLRLGVSSSDHDYEKRKRAVYSLHSLHT